MKYKPVVAIMGATSHIAKGLIANFLSQGGVRLILFGRSAGRIRSFLELLGRGDGVEIVEGYRSFGDGHYDAVINCVGAGAPRMLGNDRSVWFTLTEKFDNLVLDYLLRNPETLYVNFSSGAVYGASAGRPFLDNDQLSLTVNHLSTSDYYVLARLNAEAKHRSMEKLRIVDLRIFAYFSRFADISSGYFMTDALQALLERKELETRPWNIVRDYADPDDLFALIRICMECPKLNTALDVYSIAPAGKFELLAALECEFGLRYRVTAGDGELLPNGEKSVYCSQMRLARDIGYSPQYTSLESVLKEVRLRLAMEG